VYKYNRAHALKMIYQRKGMANIITRRIYPRVGKAIFASSWH
jgi:hypothetical protein